MDSECMVMKSVFRRFCVIILVMFFLLTGCGNILRTERESQRINTYILEPETCISLLECNPEDAEQVLTDSYWIEGKFQSANVDEEGNLVLRLSQGDIQHWKNYILEFFELRENLAIEDGTKFIIADDYKSIESYTTKEIAFGSAFFLVTTSPFCGIMQMLCGEDPNVMWRRSKWLVC